VAEPAQPSRLRPGPGRTGMRNPGLLVDNVLEVLQVDQMEAPVLVGGDGGPDGRLPGPLVQKDIVRRLPYSPLLSPIHQAWFLIGFRAPATGPHDVGVATAIHRDVGEPVPSGEGKGQFHGLAPKRLLGLQASDHCGTDADDRQCPYPPPDTKDVIHPFSFRHETASYGEESEVATYRSYLNDSLASNEVTNRYRSASTSAGYRPTQRASGPTST